ncbi:MAG: isoprenylcysteine carboxylmethyltransferase family protein [Candidatus Acidiferrales bacterium]
MKATQFEFKYRALLIALIYTVGYWLYAVDHVSAIAWLARWMLGPYAPHRMLAVKLMVGFATLLVAFGALVRTWGAAYLQSSVVHDSELHSSELVADGPYRHVRHPLYFASIVANLGFALAASRSGFFVILIAMTLLYIRLAGREEVELRREQGESYREFSQRVPKLWPSIAARVPATGAKPQWGQAFLGEAFMWGFAAAFGLFAITLSTTVLWSALGLALLIFLEQQIVHNRRRRKQAAAA